MNQDISIKANGSVYSGWLSAQVNAGVDKISRAFTLQVTKDFPSYKKCPLLPATPCEILIGDKKVITGYIDKVSISYNASNVTVTVEGRSKTSDLIESCTPPQGTTCSNTSTWQKGQDKEALEHTPISITEWSNANVDRIISDLCAPFGVNVKVTQELANKKTSFATTISDSVAKSIQKLMLVKNLVITDNEKGDLIVTKAGESHCHDSLELGVNILAASFNQDYSSLPSLCEVFSQNATKDGESARVGASNYGKAYNNLMPRLRVSQTKLTGTSNTASCKETANININYINAQANKISCTIQGWLQSNGELWKHNTLVLYKDKVFDVYETLLISDVTYTVSNSGTFTNLTLINPLAYKSDAVSTDKKASKTKKDKKEGNSKESKSKWSEVVSIK